MRGQICAYYAWANMRGIYVGGSPKMALLRLFSHVRGGLYCSRRIIERGQICVYYAWANMRGIYVGGSPKMALFTRNADVIRWEFPPSSHAYYTWDVGNAHVYYAWDMRGQKNLCLTGSYEFWLFLYILF